MRQAKIFDVAKTQCETCPFRHDSPYSYLAGDLGVSALTQSSRICHSTGSGNAINRRTGRKPMICRGARDLQLRTFHALGFISEPTDKAWERKSKIMLVGKTGI